MDLGNIASGLSDMLEGAGDQISDIAENIGIDGEMVDGIVDKAQELLDGLAGDDQQ